MSDTNLIKVFPTENRRITFPHISTRDPNPRIFVICVSSYSAGMFYGKWIDMTQSLDLIFREIDTMICRSPAPDACKWAIYASGGYDPIILGNDEKIEMIQKKAIFIASRDELKIKLLEYFDNDFELTLEALESHYQGKFKNELEFAEYLLDWNSGCSIPEFVKMYVDYEAFKKDIFNNDYYFIETAEGIHVFTIK